MRFLIIILCIILIFVPISFAEVSDWLPEEITTPLELSIWMQDNLKYIDEDRDIWKTPEQTIADGGGDCEDFAILTKHVFESWKIKNGRLAVVIMKSKDEELVGHMIYVWRMSSGNYFHMSNQYIISSNKQKITEVLDYYYPKWTKFAWITEDQFLYKFAIWHKRGDI